MAHLLPSPAARSRPSPPRPKRITLLGPGTVVPANENAALNVGAGFPPTISVPTRSQSRVFDIREQFRNVALVYARKVRPQSDHQLSEVMDLPRAPFGVASETRAHVRRPGEGRFRPGTRLQLESDTGRRDVKVAASQNDARNRSGTWSDGPIIL